MGSHRSGVQFSATQGRLLRRLGAEQAERRSQGQARPLSTQVLSPGKPQSSGRCGRLCWSSWVEAALCETDFNPPGTVGCLTFTDRISNSKAFTDVVSENQLSQR